ncbi:hypothetical protein PINS_up003321 [Pythium insidiosum]|nr:hypothetical protein PINS_up003321 [Pythium insidiosum]
MEKQPSRLHGAASTRSIAAGASSSSSPSMAPYRGASTRSVPREDHASTPSPASQVNLTSDNNHSTGVHFDALEKLGPSLLDVLTNSSRSQGEDAGENNSHSVDIEGQEPSLADATDAKFDVCVTRAAVIGRVLDPSADNARKIQEFFSKTLGQLQCEVTGLVLLQDTTVVLFLETTSDELLSLCSSLRDQQQQRVLDAASLRGLYFKKVTVNSNNSSSASSGGASDWTDDALRTLVVDAFLNLVKFVKKIGPMAPAEIRKVLSNLSNSDQTLLPSNELLLWLIAREDILTLDDFLELFAAPVMLELESERVWPVHPLLQY